MKSHKPSRFILSSAALGARDIFKWNFSGIWDFGTVVSHYNMHKALAVFKKITMEQTLKRTLNQILCSKDGNASYEDVDSLIQVLKKYKATHYSAPWDKIPSEVWIMITQPAWQETHDGYPVIPLVCREWNALWKGMESIRFQDFLDKDSNARHVLGMLVWYSLDNVVDVAQVSIYIPGISNYEGVSGEVIFMLEKRDGPWQSPVINYMTTSNNEESESLVWNAQISLGLPIQKRVDWKSFHKKIARILTPYPQGSLHFESQYITFTSLPYGVFPTGGGEKWSGVLKHLMTFEDAGLCLQIEDFLDELEKKEFRAKIMDFLLSYGLRFW